MSDSIIDFLLPAAEQLSRLGYWLAFLAALLETTLIVGLFIPGSTLLLAFGAVAATGHLDFGTLLWFAIAGAVIGDNLNYALGKRYGRRWTRDGIWLVKREHFDNAGRFFDRHGGRSVFLGRFVPTAKELVPFVAGTLGMHRAAFMIWNLLGAMGWGLEWLGAGYLFAHSLNLAQVWLPRAGLLLAFLLVGSLLLLWCEHMIFRHGRRWLRFWASVWHSISMAVTNNPDVIVLVQRHPRMFAFLGERLGRGNFSGRPLTLAILASAYVLILFGGIIEDVLSRDPIVAIDHNLAQIVATLRTPDLVHFFIRITGLGKWQVVFAFALIAAVILWLTHRRWFITGLLTSIAGSIAFTNLGKLVLHRPRPAEAVLVENSYSFPSGHATAAVAFYGFLGYLLIRNAGEWRRRINWFFATLVLILSIGLSRIVLGVHYLSDVWGGFLVGALWLIIGISVNECLARKGGPDLNRPVGAGVKKLSFALICAAAAGYGGFASVYEPRFAKAEPVEVRRVTGNPVTVLKTRTPGFAENALGQQEMPLGLIVLARDPAGLRHAFQSAGWQRPQPLGARSLVGLLRKRPRDAQAPLPPAFWNGRVNDLAFERIVETSRGARLIAVWLWSTPYLTPQGTVFVALAKAFDGVRWGILRGIDPDLDAARDALVASLRAAGLADNARLVPYGPPVSGRTLIGNQYFSRGNIWFITLPQPGP